MFSKIRLHMNENINPIGIQIIIDMKNGIKNAIK